MGGVEIGRPAELRPKFGRTSAETHFRTLCTPTSASSLGVAFPEKLNNSPHEIELRVLLQTTCHLLTISSSSLCTPSLFRIDPPPSTPPTPSRPPPSPKLEAHCHPSHPPGITCLLFFIGDHLFVSRISVLTLCLMSRHHFFSLSFAESPR
jgi:hypothetical protein